MANYDIETFFDQLETFLIANLNTKITAINAEKADSITLASVSSSAYFFLTLDEQVANYDPFIFYTIGGISSNGIGPGTGKTYLVDVALIMTNDGVDSNSRKRTLRYHRAITELFEENYANIDKRVNIKVESLEPITFAAQNDSQFYRAVGVQLQVTLA